MFFVGRLIKTRSGRLQREEKYIHKSRDTQLRRSRTTPGSPWWCADAGGEGGDVWRCGELRHKGPKRYRVPSSLRFDSQMHHRGGGAAEHIPPLPWSTQFLTELNCKVGLLPTKSHLLVWESLLWTCGGDSIGVRGQKRIACHFLGTSKMQLIKVVGVYYLFGPHSGHLWKYCHYFWLYDSDLFLFFLVTQNWCWHRANLLQVKMQLLCSRSRIEVLRGPKKFPTKKTGIWDSKLRRTAPYKVLQGETRQRCFRSASDSRTAVSHGEQRALQNWWEANQPVSRAAQWKSACQNLR